MLVELGGLAVATGQRVPILFSVFAPLRVGVLAQALLRLLMGALEVLAVAVTFFKLVERAHQSKDLMVELVRRQRPIMVQVEAVEHRKLELMV